MWLLRGIGKIRWLDRRADEPTHVAAAAKDLSLRPGEEGLSLFQVDDEEDGRRVATLLGVYKALERGRLVHLDYILIPPDVFATLGLSAVPVPDPALGPELSGRHCETKGITDDQCAACRYPPGREAGPVRSDTEAGGRQRGAPRLGAG